jgi:SMC interacting uncharacterized protein involved in chromosome segregation
VKNKMSIYSKSNSDWEKLEQGIEETVNLIMNLKAENKTLEEKNQKLEEEKRTYNAIKKKMKKKIKELIDKLSAIKE